MPDSEKRIVLASASEVRARLLRAAGVPFEAAPAHVDEAEVKLSMQAEPVEAVVEALALLKAQQVSRRFPNAFVIGADQMLECEGRRFDKPENLDQARAQLGQLRGRAHDLVGCVMVVKDGARLWHHVGRATLEMRDFSEDFLSSYLAAVGEEALKSVGAYQMEGLGAQLFARVKGDYFAILGLALLPLLDFLRTHEVLKR
ncbi:MAG: septum formation protein Maf [Alphaproteobacteria bacterium]|nr:septum formation protein Maf [Alphaproteobacteria bacterium]